MFSIFSPPRKSCHLRENVEEYSNAGEATDDNMGMRISHWSPKAKHTHTHTHTQNMQYLMLFPPHQWLHERISMLLLTYIACLANYLTRSHQFSGGCINPDSLQDISEITHLKVTNAYKITT